MSTVDIDPLEYGYQLRLARQIESWGDFELQLADYANQQMELHLAKDSLAKASTPEPFSSSKTSNWVAKLGGLPDYIQHVAHGILRSPKSAAKTVSQAIQMAIGVIKRWAAGGGKVDATTRAAAAKALAEWEKMKAEQAGKRGAKAAA